jgi:hypothetical protein
VVLSKENCKLLQENTKLKGICSKENSGRKNLNLEEVDFLVSQHSSHKSLRSSFETEDSLHSDKDLLVSVCHLIRET